MIRTYRILSNRSTFTAKPHVFVHGCSEFLSDNHQRSSIFGDSCGGATAVIVLDALQVILSRCRKPIGISRSHAQSSMAIIRNSGWAPLFTARTGAFQRCRGNMPTTHLAEPV